MGTPVHDLTPLTTLNALENLVCFGTVVADLTPLTGLTALRSLDLAHTKIADLTPLVGLTNLQYLSFFRTQVADLTPIGRLTALQHLFCGRTKVTDLRPVAELTALRIVDCGYTQVSDLKPLEGLAALETLGFWHTQIDDLAPIVNLADLQIINCSRTLVSDLTPLAGLTALELVDCSETPVSDLTPLANLAALRTLSCSETEVADLTPIASLSSLQTLDCSFTNVADLRPIASLSNLSSLNIFGCMISHVPRKLLEQPTLEKLVASTIPVMPEEVLSENDLTNCLPLLRAHLTDLGEHPKPIDGAKLMILGNGRIGKTQLARRLRAKHFEENADSTHGILVTDAPVPQRPDDDLARFHIWDFGGQDLYHGTHALFLRSRAVFLVCWTPEMEESETHEHAGLRFRNYPLAYWLDHVRQFAAEGAPVIVVQTRADALGDKQPMPPEAREIFETFRHRFELDVSAKTPRGLGALREALAETYALLNQPLIGPGRAAVKRRLEEWRSADAARPVAERERQWIDYEEYRALCAEIGNVSDPDMLLRFLHNAGTVFHQEGLFENRIILDQGWALEAIYAVFHRDRCWRALKNARGRFTRADLGAYLWDEQFRIEEQRLFLSMMESCGICFVHDLRWRDADATVYIAPELLPNEPPPLVARLWPEDDERVESRTLRFPVLPATLIRSIIATIGKEAGLDAEYWARGLATSERTSGSELLVEEVRDAPGGWSGAIVVRARALDARGRPGELLERIVEVVRREATRYGLTPEEDEPRRRGRDAETEEKMGLDYVQPKPAPVEHIVSYAWADDRTPEGMNREEAVDRICAEYEARGITIVRDKTHLGMGESIGKFMRRIGEADRVFVFLSEQYLRSPFCMGELMEIWRIRQGDEDLFFKHVRIFTLGDADIWRPEGRYAYAAHWEARFEAFKQMTKEGGAHLLSERDQAALRSMRLFAHITGEILSAIADRVQPRTFEDFLAYGFDDR